MLSYAVPTGLSVTHSLLMCSHLTTAAKQPPNNILDHLSLNKVIMSIRVYDCNLLGWGGFKQKKKKKSKHLPWNTANVDTRNEMNGTPLHQRQQYVHNSY